MYKDNEFDKYNEFNKYNEFEEKNNKKNIIISFILGSIVGGGAVYVINNNIDAKEDLLPEVYIGEDGVFSEDEIVFPKLKGEIVDVSSYTRELNINDYKYETDMFYYDRTISDGSHLYIKDDYINNKILIHRLDNSNINILMSLEFNDLSEDAYIKNIIELKDGNILINIEDCLDNEYTNYYYIYNSKGELIYEDKYIGVDISEINYFKEADKIVMLAFDKSGSQTMVVHDALFNELFNRRVDYSIVDIFMDEKNIYLNINEENSKILKLDENGDLIYQKDIYKENTLDVYETRVTSDGGLIISAKEYLDETMYNVKSVIIKLDKNGDREWIQEIDGDIENVIIKETSDGYLVFNQSCYYSNDGEGYTNSIPAVVKFSKDGKEILNKKFAIMYDDSTNKSAFSLSKAYVLNNNIIIEGANELESYTTNIKFSVDDNGEIRAIN